MTNLEQQNVENPVDVSVENPEAVDLSDTMALLDADVDADFSWPTGWIFDKLFADKSEPKNGENKDTYDSSVITKIGTEVANLFKGAFDMFKSGAAALEKEPRMDSLWHAVDGLGEFSDILSDIMKMSRDLKAPVNPALVPLKAQVEAQFSALKKLYNFVNDPETGSLADQTKIRDAVREAAKLIDDNLTLVQTEYISLLQGSVQQQTQRAQRAEQRARSAEGKVGAAEQRARAAEGRARAAEQRAVSAEQRAAANQRWAVGWGVAWSRTSEQSHWNSRQNHTGMWGAATRFFGVN